MENQIVRLVVLVFLIFLLTSDIKDLMDALSTTSNVGGPFFSWKRGDSLKLGQRGDKSSRNKRNVNPSIGDDVNTVPMEDELEPIKFYTPIPTGRTKSKLKSGDPSDSNKINPNDAFGSLTEEEKQELLAMKSHLTKVMQDWCLPKLVCELHASIGGRDTLSEAERGLLSIIKETSMNPMGEVISRYHFAAHMGQLLADVEGNGCHNFYPNCPLSGAKVLQMVKKVRIV